MLDETFSFPKSESKSFDAMPIGIYQCELTDIEVKDGTDFKGNPSKNLSFTFRVVEDGEFYGRKLWANASMKMIGGSKPSNLFNILCKIADKTFTKQECDSAHDWLTFVWLTSFLGKQQILAVGQKQKQDGSGFRNTIDSIMPVKAQLPAFQEKK